ncbi:MAG: GNAT family N-acetyltransferase [Tannerella sp.]|jgi:ribosomal protein S18 acetylase RimI-like enzyme|nr:GNAT family N-acetyltransferase [Tannerella sp.]
MNQRLVMREVKEGSDPVLASVERTYTAAFPVKERRDFALVRELLACETRFRLCGLFHERQYIGFISFWQFEGFTYIEHFAIDESRRNEGWGGAALRAFTAQVHPVVLEAEPPGDEWSRRRIRFYERLGFVVYPHPYLQPPYRTGDPWIPLCLMKYGKPHPELLFGQVKQTIYRYVYQVIPETTLSPELPHRDVERGD